MLTVICFISITACPTEPPTDVEQPLKTLAKDITIDANKTNYAVILLYDGKQFELQDPGNYNCRSYSALFTAYSS